MDYRMQIMLIICILLYLIVILCLLKKGKLNLRYTLLWFLTAVVMLVFTIFPEIVNWLTGLAGIQLPSNFVFFMEGIFVLILLLSLTSIVSRLTSRLTKLTQAQALLEKRVRDLEEALREKE
jgi:hypothetical protein